MNLVLLPRIGPAQIPILGLGTWDLRGRTCARVVEQALGLGYRHVDTAEMYDNEREVGDGLRASGIRRDQVFITTKVWPSHFKARDLERSAKESVTRLRLSDVDLLLLHWPNPQVSLSETIAALCEVKRTGLARNIGISNFTVALIEQAVKLSKSGSPATRSRCTLFSINRKSLPPVGRMQLRSWPIVQLRAAA